MFFFQVWKNKDCKRTPFYTCVMNTVTIGLIGPILTGKRNATLGFCQVRHVVHKHELHELTMTRTLNPVCMLFSVHM